MNKLTIEVTGTPIDNGLSLGLHVEQESEGIQQLAMLFNALMEGAVDLFKDITGKMSEEEEEMFMACLLGFALQSKEQSNMQNLVQSFSKN